MNVRTNAVRGGWDSDRCRGRLGCSALPLVWLGWQRAQDSGRRDPAHHCEVRCDPTERCHCRSAKPHAVRSMGHVVHVVRCTLCVAARAATEAMRTLVRSELDCFGTRRRGGKRSRDGADIATEEYDIELKTSRDVSSDRVPPARPPARPPPSVPPPPVPALLSTACAFGRALNRRFGRCCHVVPPCRLCTSAWPLAGVAELCSVQAAKMVDPIVPRRSADNRLRLSRRCRRASAVLCPALPSSSIIAPRQSKDCATVAS